MKNLFLIAFGLIAFLGHSQADEIIGEKKEGVVFKYPEGGGGGFENPATATLNMSSFDVTGVDEIDATIINIGTPLSELRGLNIRGGSSQARVFLEGTDASSNPGIEASIADNSKGIIRLTRTGTDGTKWQFYNEADGGALTAKWEMVSDNLVALTSGAITGISAVGSASAADLTKLSQLTPTSTELNHVAGVTSSIQTQIDSKDGSETSVTAGTGGITVTGSGTSGSPYVISDDDAGGGASAPPRVMVSDSTYTLLNTDKGKIHEFWADVESISFTLPATPDDDAEWTLAQMTDAKVGSTDSLRSGPNVGHYRSTGGGKYMTVYSVSDTTRLRVLGGIEPYTYSNRGPELAPALADASGWEELNEGAGKTITFSGGEMQFVQDTGYTLQLRESNALIIGQEYEVIFITSAYSGSPLSFYSFAGSPEVSNGVGPITITGEATSEHIQFLSESGTAVDVTASSISVKQITD